MTRPPSNIGITFEEDFKDAVRLFTENAEVDRHNAEKLNKIGNPITLLMAINRRRANKWMQGRGPRYRL
uniref:Uncharacterized protein n=1 Tax=Hyaloperonospora arabidopsidis (strain Emoy2) TaxID=559515 RepID=M4BGT7_HYAAE